MLSISIHTILLVLKKSLQKTRLDKGEPMIALLILGSIIRWAHPPGDVKSPLRAHRKYLFIPKITGGSIPILNYVHTLCKVLHRVNMIATPLLQFLTQSIANSPTDIERDTSERPPRLCWFNDSDIEWILIKIILMMFIPTFRSYVDTDGDD